MGSRVLVIDDEKGIRWVVREELTREGHEVITAKNGQEALEKLPELAPDVVLVDLRMPVMDGITFMREAQQLAPNLPMIAMSGCGTIDDAVKVMQLGAADFIEKPFTISDVSKCVEQALFACPDKGEKADKEKEQDQYGAVAVEELSAEQAGGTVVGRSRKMREIYTTIKRISRSDTTSVFIQGESGTGKELIARAVHFTSSRRDARFTAVNCAALTESLLEAELFGYEKGAFTGATTDGKVGLFEVTDGGTMFLDEIAEMSTDLQSKLLRVLQEGTFRRVGGIENIPVDVRIVASTNRKLKKTVAEGSFREDLFYRLNVVPIHVPPLRERKDDIPLIVEYYLKQYDERFSTGIGTVSPEAYEELMAYEWPGNVRELKNTIERAVLLETSSTITTRYLMLGGHKAKGQTSDTLELVDRSVASVERQLIQKVLRETFWQRTEAAKLLGIHRTTLANKIKEYGLDKNPPAVTA